MNSGVDGGNRDKAKSHMALNIKIVLLVLLGGAIALFLIQNVANVEIQFLFWSIEMRRATLVLLVLGIGVIIGWILHGIQTRTRRRREEARLSNDSGLVSGSEQSKIDFFDRDQ